MGEKFDKALKSVNRSLNFHIEHCNQEMQHRFIGLKKRLAFLDKLEDNLKLEYLRNISEQYIMFDEIIYNYTKEAQFFKIERESFIWELEGALHEDLKEKK